MPMSTQQFKRVNSTLESGSAQKTTLSFFILRLAMVFTQKSSSPPSILDSSSSLMDMSKATECKDQPKMSHVSEEVMASGEFISLEKYKYKDQNGVERSWEVAGRTSQPEIGGPDCVGSLAVLRRLLKYDCLILVKQYRPALKQYTLEFPAGLVDPSEKPEETAIRELREETGYATNTVKHSSALTALDPGFSRCTMKMVTLEVNGDELANRNPRQSDDDSSTIEVIHIPINELLPRLNEISEQGVVVDSRVYCFAIGLTIGAKNATYKLTANPY